MRNGKIFRHMPLRKQILKMMRLVSGVFIYRDYWAFSMDNKNNRFQLSLFDLYPITTDKTEKTQFDRHYVYHLAWAARKIVEIKPKHHVDISSSLHFATIVSAFVPMKFYDYRPADITLSDFESGKINLLRLPCEDNSINSLSCMHTVEHVGLGRYGDQLDPEGDLKAMAELQRVVAIGGSLLVVVPVGKPKIEFNAHRIYSLEQIIGAFPKLKLQEFVLIPEKSGEPMFNATAADVEKETYACGCFWFKKSAC